MSGLPAAGDGPTYVEMIQKMGNLQDITKKVNDIAEQNTQASTDILKRIGIIRERITNLSALWTKKTSEIEGLQKQHTANIENLTASHEAALEDATKQGSASSIELAALKDAIVAADQQYTDQSVILMESINSTLIDDNILEQMKQLYNDVNALSTLVGTTPMTPMPMPDPRRGTGPPAGPPAGPAPGDQEINYDSEAESVSSRSSMSSTGSIKRSPEEIQANVDKLKRRPKQNLDAKAAEAQTSSTGRPKRNIIPVNRLDPSVKGQSYVTPKKGGSRKKRRRSSKKRHHITRRKHHSKKKQGGRKSLKKHKKDQKKKRPMKRVTFKKHH